jgi:hypothetical protein
MVNTKMIPHRTAGALLLFLVGPFLCGTVSSAHQLSEVPFALEVSWNERVHFVSPVGWSTHDTTGQASCYPSPNVPHHESIIAHQLILFKTQEEEEHHHHHHHHHRHGRSVVAKVGTIQRCGTPDLKLSAEDKAKIRARIASYGETDNKIFGVVTVDVAFRVIHDGAVGNLPDQAIKDQMDVLNQAYAPYKFQFRLREIIRTNNAALYAACGQGVDGQEQFKPQLRNPNDGPNVLYIYTCDLSTAQPDPSLGYSTFPSDYVFLPLLDGVVCTFTSFPGGVAPNNLGHTATHEVGHW